MKRLLTILPILICYISNATNYYVDSTGGNDTNNGTSTGTAWRTVSKVNSFALANSPGFVAGDSILFKRGQTYPGGLVLLDNGSSGNHIIYAAYGSGAKPIITGLTAVTTSFSNLGSNLWRADVTSLGGLGTFMNVVIIGGVNTPCGRFPNATSTNQWGTLTYSANTGTTITADAALSANWVGAQVVLRKGDFVADRGRVTGQSGNTITYTASNPATAGADNCGFYFQNDVDALDQQNEWFYDTANKLLTIYSTSSPTNVKIATVATLVSGSSRSFSTFYNIEFNGSNYRMIDIGSSNTFIFDSCTFKNCGNNTFWVSGASNLQVKNSSISNTGNTIMLGSTCSGFLLQDITARDNGVNPGLVDASNGECYQGFRVLGGSNNTFRRISIVNQGYHGIKFSGSNILIVRCFVDTFCVNLTDGGGIYTWSGDGSGTGTNRVIDSCIVLHQSPKTVNGSANAANAANVPAAIYLDDLAANVVVRNSTGAYSAKGIYLHNAFNNTLRFNTFYESVYGGITARNDGLHAINGSTITRNIICEKTSSGTNYPALKYQSPSNDITSVGVSDTNVYARPVSDNTTMLVIVGSTGTFRTLAQHQAAFPPLEAHSTKSPKVIPDTTSANIRFYYNETSSPKVFAFSGQTWIDLLNVSYSQSVTLQPYTSKILLFSNNVSGTPLSISLAATTNPLTCNGNSTTITATGVGGTTPYKFKVGTGTYQSVSGNTYSFTATAGTYSVTIQDATLAVATASITITQPNAILITEKHGTILVNGQTTSDTVTATGGTSPYQYSMNGGPYQTSNIFTLGASNNHTVTVKDANSCTKSYSFAITQPSVLALSLGSSSITCNGGLSTITATATGGTTPYKYRLGTGSLQLSNLFTGNRAGTYTVTVQDSLGSVVSTNITITEPAVITISLSYGTAPATVVVTAGGGAGSFTYSMNGTTYQSSSTFSGVAAGSYTMYVKDGNGCINTKQFSVVVSSLHVTIVKGTITCNGGSASVQATPTGGTTPYTYLWSNGITTSSTTLPAPSGTLHVADNGGQVFDTSFVITQPAPVVVSVSFGTAPTTVTATCTSGCVGTPNYSLDNGIYQASNQFLNVGAGSHTVYIKDANGCIGTKAFNVVTGGTPLSISSLTPTALTCNGNATGQIAIVATGGTAPYQYKLSYWSLYQASSTITGLGAGTYTVNVRDNVGAVVSGTVTVTQPAAITASLSYGAAPATVVVTAGGGAGGFNYKIDNLSYQVSNSFSNVAAGSHTITIKDANSCTLAKSFTVLSSGLSVSLSVGTITCNGGTTSATATPSGGVSPYFYLWSNNQTTATATGLTAGTRTLHVTDNASHVFDTSFVITQPSAITISSISFSAILTNGGSTTVNVTASGGVPSLTYSLDGGVYQSSSSFAGVTAGNHTMDVKDANGCIVRRSFSITQPGVLVISVEQITTIDCYGDSASMGVTATGGTPPYTGVDTFNVAAGTRTYTVRDAFNAIADSIVTVTQPDAVVASARNGTIAVRGGSTYVVISGTGGTGGYTYQLDGSGYSATDSITGVLAGNHIAYVKDANGCIDQYSFTITQPKRNKTHPFIPAMVLFNSSWLAENHVLDSKNTFPRLFEGDKKSDPRRNGGQMNFLMKIFT